MLATAKGHGTLGILAGACATSTSLGVPDENDPTLSYRQIAAMQQNLRGIEREADTYGMRFLPVHNAQEGAEKVVQYA